MLLSQTRLRVFNALDINLWRYLNCLRTWFHILDFDYLPGNGTYLTYSFKLWLLLDTFHWFRLGNFCSLRSISWRWDRLCEKDCADTLRWRSLYHISDEFRLNLCSYILSIAIRLDGWPCPSRHFLSRCELSLWNIVVCMFDYLWGRNFGFPNRFCTSRIKFIVLIRLTTYALPVWYGLI